MARLENSGLASKAEELLEGNLQGEIEQYIADARRLKVMTRCQAIASVRRAFEATLKKFPEIKKEEGDANGSQDS